MPDNVKLATFLAINYGALLVGYAWGVRKGRTALRRTGAAGVGSVRVTAGVMWLIVGSMAFTIAADMLRLYAIRGGFGAVISPFLNPGEAYRQAQTLAQLDREGTLKGMVGFSWAFRISTVLAVFNGLYFPLAVVGWPSLRLRHRLLFLAAVSSAILFTVGLGAQSGIGVLAFSLVPVVLYKAYVVARPLSAPRATGIPMARKRRAHPMRAKLLMAGALCALVATVAYFQIDRTEESGRDLDAVKELGGQFATTSDRGIVPVTGGRTNFGLVMACMYVSHGYEGLALSMESPFEWTYGLGWSKGLQELVRDYLGGPDLSQATYVARTGRQTDWPSSWWSTIFPWVASDTSFSGTALFTGLVGFVIARCWVDVIVAGNPIGFAVLAQMFTLVFMFPANNALAQTLEGLFSLIGVFCIYGLSRKHFRPYRRRPVSGPAVSSEL